jgi:hypothetical protein
MREEHPSRRDETTAFQNIGAVPEARERSDEEFADLVIVSPDSAHNADDDFGVRVL